MERKNLLKEVFDSVIENVRHEGGEGPLKVYLAGEIKENGWRQCIINMRDDSPAKMDASRQNFKGREIMYSQNVAITGPFFISCDHGCYHGERNHGVGLEHKACAENSKLSRTDVFEICREQIRNADIVFAYINDGTCFGTLFELGYACACGKKIAILFDSDKRFKDMWFIAEGADAVFVENPKQGYSLRLFHGDLNLMGDKRRM